MEIKVQCPKCKYHLEIGPAVATLVLFNDRPPMSFFHITCPRPQCEHEWNCFIDDDFSTVKKVLDHINQNPDWEVQLNPKTPDWVVAEYEEVNEYKLVHPVELSERQEAHLRVLEWELKTATVQDILDTDIENRLPRACI